MYNKQSYEDDSKEGVVLSGNKQHPSKDKKASKAATADI